MTTDINKFLTGIAQGPSGVFAGIFAISCGLHIWQSRKYRSWPYTWPLPCACLLMMAGFISREIVADDDRADDLASVVQGLFYSAIPTFAIPLYTFLHCSPVSSELLPWLNQTISYIVVWCFTSAVISCTAQGCSTYFNPDAKRSSIKPALALVKASLFLQLVPNAAMLCILVAVFIVRRNNVNNTDTAAGHRRQLQMLVLSLFGLTTLMILRNVFRTVQIFASSLSGIWTEEAYFWVFEGCVMVCFTALFHVLHPAKYVSLGYGTGQNAGCG